MTTCAYTYFLKSLDNYAAGKFVTQMKVRHRNRNKPVRLINTSLGTQAIIYNHCFVPGTPQIYMCLGIRKPKLAHIFSDNSVDPRSFNRIFTVFAVHRIITVFAGLTVKRPNFWLNQVAVVHS